VTPSSGRSRGIRTPSFGKAAAKLKSASKESLTLTTNGRITPTTDGRVTPDAVNRMDISLPNTPTTIRTPTNSMTTPGSSKNMPETPTSARRAALYERIRKKSESDEGSMKKTAVTATVRSSSKEPNAQGHSLVERKVVKMVGPEELRRRVILGRLGGIAESVWMLFSSSGANGAVVTNASRKRRALERREVVRAIVTSSKVPISEGKFIPYSRMHKTDCEFMQRRQSKVWPCSASYVHSF
jgi:hypothetical protein